MTINSTTAENCCGCRACEIICPQKCIVMKTDPEGFLISSINEEKCINCGICEKVCPVITPPHENSIIQVFAMQHLDNRILADSSSGGAFRFIADPIIDDGGIVCSCAFDENNNAIFTIAALKDEIKKFQGSKYVQSDTRDSFIHIRYYLEKGTKVFFAGAPCQCAALKNYLKKDYDNLYTADFLCHGMPSGWIFKEYVSYLERKKGTIISNVQFRDKSARGWGLWFSYEQLKNNKKKKVIRNVSVDSYEYAFQKSMMNRPLCYQCPFQGKRYTDFTYADYWGVEKFHPEFEKSKGVSVLSANTKKALDFIDDNKGSAYLVETTVDHASAQNESLVRKEERIIPDVRYSIYSDVKEKGWGPVGRSLMSYKIYWINRIWYSLPHRFVNMIKGNHR